MPYVPGVLAKVFVCVPFFWNVHKLPTLRLVTQEIKGWPTEVSVRIISNQPDRLAGTLESWKVGASFQAVLGPANHTHPFELTWAHRSYMLEAMQSGQYSAFVYLEDDLPMRWQTLLSWAHDNEVLEPMGLQRQFYRTEIAPWNGRPYMTDARGYTSLDKAISVSRTVHLQSAAASGHTDFVALSDPYSAMYVASAAVMHKFAASPQWTDRNSPWSSWGAEAGGEMAANAIIFLDPPPGFWSAGVVPYDAASKTILPIAAVEHASNRLCAELAAKHGFHDHAPDASLGQYFCAVEPHLLFFESHNLTHTGLVHSTAVRL